VLRLRLDASDIVMSQKVRLPILELAIHLRKRSRGLFLYQLLPLC
jgi:hypothetical protein